MHGRSAKMKRVPLTLAKGFVSERCVETVKGNVAPSQESSFYNQVKIVETLLLEGQVTCQWMKSSNERKNKNARTKFRKCCELLYEKKLLLNINERIYQLCKIVDVAWERDMVSEA